MRRALDGAVASLSRLLLRIFFRQVEVVGRERVPPRGPLLLVANHENSLIDPILVLGFLGVRPRILAKSTLWRHPVVAPLLVFAGAVPVYRKQDGVAMARNLDTFARCRETLARGANVLLFPEGASHNQPHRLPLKTGAARIALETMVRDGAADLRIVPVGLSYEAKGEFGSRVLVLIGEALDPRAEAVLYASAPRAAVRELTERMAAALEAVTASHPTWEEARLVERGVGLVSRLPGAPLSERFALRARLLEAYADLDRKDPARAGELVDAVARHDRALADAGLTDVDLEPPAENRLSPAERAALSVPALIGAVLNVVPYRLPGWLSDRLSRTPDEPATYKLLAALLFFPLAWLLEASAAWAWCGPWWGLAIALLAPATGYAALRWVKARRAPARPADPHVLEALRAERAQLRQEIRGELEGRRFESMAPSSVA